MSIGVRSCPPVGVALIWLELMRHSGPILRRLLFTPFLCVPLVFSSAAIFFLALPVRAQDAAAAARQNQALKAKEHHPPLHVYTNDDLKRPHILTPQDQARVEARKRNSPLPASLQPAQTLDAGSPHESLGEIARRYRREKAAREAQQALKNQPSHFQLKLPATSLAAPKPGLVPRGDLGSPMIRGKRGSLAPASSLIVPGLRSRRFIVPSVPRVPRVLHAPKRISPFQPRPLLAPVRPAPSRSLPAISAYALRRVVVKPGDSFWKLSREYLGRGARWQELLAVNPGWNNPNYIAVGSEIFVPRNSKASTFKKNTPNRVTVHRGDTLWSLSHAYFGRGSAWICLARANPTLRNPDLILPGEQLLVPASCSATP